ncbi:MAG: chemotaxis protein CheW [Methylocystis sp.]|nr:chemotaxis protein CheW [Methylocystis sp.]
MTSFDLADFSYSRKRAPAKPVAERRFFTIKARGQTVGLPVNCVKTIFHVDNLTAVPLAPREVAGLVNLRGRIVTALHLGRCLWLDDAVENGGGLAVGIEQNGEEYALFVDGTDDVVVVDEADRIGCPAHVDPRLAELLAGCYRRGDDFLSILDVDALLQRVVKSGEALLMRDGMQTGSTKGAKA